MAMTPLQLNAQNLVAAIVRKEVPAKSMQECNAIAWEILEGLKKMNELSELCSVPADVPLVVPEASK